MVMMSTMLSIFIIVCILVNVDSLCNVCQKNYAACLDETNYAMCTGGKPDEKIRTCPVGYVCTASASICLKQSETKPVTPSCVMTCGVCSSPGKLFSCLTSTTYAYCFGKDVPDLSAKGVCPDGYVCSVESSEICMKAAEYVPSCNADNDPITSPGTTESSTQTTIKPTDSGDKTTEPGIITTIEPTTAVTDGSVSSPTQPSTKATTLKTTTSSTLTTTQRSQFESRYCKEKQIQGPHRSENDSTCQKFTLCYLLAGQYLELQYICSGSSFFNEQTKNCQTEKPIDCK